MLLSLGALDALILEPKKPRTDMHVLFMMSKKRVFDRKRVTKNDENVFLGFFLSKGRGRII